MGPQARREYLLKMRSRYFAAERSKRSGLLDEIVAVTGFHRKAVIRALAREPSARRRPARPTSYGPEVVAVLVAIWTAADYPWSVRLKAILPQWLPWAKKRRPIDAACEAALLGVSARTIDRLLHSRRGELRRRHYGRTKPGTLLKHQVPIRSERWDVNEPGWGEIDTVHHCGDSAFGEYIYSLNFTDIASTWTEGRAVVGKAQSRVVAAMGEIAEDLPFALKGLDSDSGSEFINEHFVRFCRQRELTFTRSRPYKKNDNAHIEQKNWTHVRKLFGWQRLYEGHIAELMNDLYRNELRIWMNLFQPSVKLVEKQRVGSRTRRTYDRPQTPLERLIALGCLEPAQRAALEALRDRTDPFELSERIDRKLGAIRKAAQEQRPQPAARPPGAHPPAPVAHLRRRSAARSAVKAAGNTGAGAMITRPVTS
jgi:transposase InsO family protein